MLGLVFALAFLSVIMDFMFVLVCSIVFLSVFMDSTYA